MWVRGLKHNVEFYVRQRKYVAPRVGAWIETQGVAILAASMMSHPVWVRGLKLHACRYLSHVGYVAPRVGAWIET